MKQLVKKTKSLIVLALACAMLASVAFADELPDPAQKGSISITLVDHVTGKAIPGGEIEVIKVADINIGSSSYDYTSEFVGCGIALDNFSDSKLPEKFAEYIKTKGITGSTHAIDDAGKVTVSNLTLGAYIVKQTKAAAGFFPFNTFLVTVPVLENGAWVYNVDATPKMDPTKAMTPTATPSPTVTPNPAGPSITPNNSSSTDVPSPTPPEKLPQTGQLKWPIPVLAIAGLITFAIGWLLFTMKDDDEK